MPISGALHNMDDPEGSARNLLALGIHGADEDMDDLRIRLLDEIVFCRQPIKRQPFTSHRRLLSTSSSKRI